MARPGEWARKSFRFRYSETCKWVNTILWALFTVSHFAEKIKMGLDKVTSQRMLFDVCSLGYKG